MGRLELESRRRYFVYTFVNLANKHISSDKGVFSRLSVFQIPQVTTGLFGLYKKSDISFKFLCSCSSRGAAAT